MRRIRKDDNPNKKLTFALDEVFTQELYRSMLRNNRTRTAEAKLRLQDHLIRFPDFTNIEAKEV